MEEQQQPPLANTAITRKHFNKLVHRVDAEKLRFMLREKCRIRVRESRQKKYDISRSFLQNEKEWLTDMLKGQLSDIDRDILLEDVVLEEMVEEYFQWMVDQYEHLEDPDLLGDSKQLFVLCPICQVSELSIKDNILHCRCGFQQTFNGSLEDFWKKVQKKVAEHEDNCLSKLTFYVDPSESGLNLICQDCEFVNLVE